MRSYGNNMYTFRNHHNIFKCLHSVLTKEYGTGEHSLDTNEI